MRSLRSSATRFVFKVSDNVTLQLLSRRFLCRVACWWATHGLPAYGLPWDRGCPAWAHGVSQGQDCPVTKSQTLLRLLESWCSVVVGIVFVFVCHAHCATENTCILCIAPSGVEFRCVHLLQFFNVCNCHVSFPDFNPRIRHTRRIFLTRLSDQTDVIAKDLSQKQCDIRPLLQTVFLVRWMAFRTAFRLVFPTGQEIMDVSRIAVTFHGIRPPFFTQTRVPQYTRCPFLNSANCSFKNLIRFRSLWCWRTMIPR